MESLSPTTTAEEDRFTAGQRLFYIIWEVTQAIVALSITFAVIYAILSGINTAELSNAFFLIIGFYFGRTNHSRAEKPNGHTTR